MNARVHALPAREWVESAADYPWHLAMAAAVCGLLAGELPDGAIAVGALAVAALARSARGGLALLGVAAACAGATEWRLARDAAVRTAFERAGAVHGEALLLEPLRPRRDGTRAARVRWLGQPARGAVLVARLPADGPAAQVGDELTLAGRVGPLTRWERYQAARGAKAGLSAWSVRLTGRRRAGPLGAIDAIRRRAERSIEAGLPHGPAALARGMVLGQDERIADDLRADFRRSGLAHLLAVSGQNVLLLVALAVLIGAAVGLGLRGRLTLALGLVVLYVPLAGGGPSIVRAGIMGVAGLVAALAGRPASRWYALLLAAALTLAWNPRGAEDVGWQLSFAAVVALMALTRPLAERLALRGFPVPIAEATAMTLAATLGTAPLLAHHFEQLSLVSLPANVLAAPLVAPIMWLGTLGAAAGQLAPGLALPCLLAAEMPLRALALLAEAAAAVPGASVGVKLPGWPATAAAYAAVIALGLGLVRAGLRRVMRIAVPVAAAAALAALALGGASSAAEPMAPGELRLTFLDIGQGHATLIQHAGRTALVDTGPDPALLARRLREAGVRHIDLLVLTHGSLDHDGAARTALPLTTVLLDGGSYDHSTQRGLVEDAVAHRRVRRALVHAGERVQFGALRIDVLSPREPTTPKHPPPGDPNDIAAVLLLRVPGFTALLPADAEANVTARLSVPRVDVLQVAHHGSRDAELPALLSMTHPRIAVISVGAHNHYGHPAPETLRALRVVPRVLRTDRVGTVRVRVLAPGRVRIEQTRGVP